MSTSYSKNMHLSNLFVYSCMSIKTGLLFFLTFRCIIFPIFGIIDHYCIMENLKKIGRREEQIKNNVA